MIDTGSRHAVVSMYEIAHACRDAYTGPIVIHLGRSFLEAPRGRPGRVFFARAWCGLAANTTNGWDDHSPEIKKLQCPAGVLNDGVYL
ncbi:hypothetical protein MTO96_005380 [Rhipicephalus appendiculatus]